MATIVVINNDTDFLSLMNELLMARGWNTVVCRESAMAFSTVKQVQPDMVVLDIRMESPEAGWNILELIKLDPKTTAIPVLICSAASLDLEAKKDWLEDRRISTLNKPFDINDLYSAIERALATESP